MTKGGLKEGWGDMRPGDRVYHYMVPPGTSLCGKIGLHAMHADTLSADSGNLEANRKDCKPCFKRLLSRRRATR